MASRPKYQVLVYHTDSDKERPTEVGALWPLKDGKDGYMLSIKRGLGISNLQGMRIVCLPVTDRSERGGRSDD